MNEQQYYKWKADTYEALVASGIYSAEQAQIVIDWFDSIKGTRERQWFVDELADALSKHWSDYPYENFVYKTMTTRAWLYADKILHKHKEQN
ncbi:hypothetical protein [Aeromonas phage 4L372D]|uniref:Uncharacterized protein n=2 Tax=Plateaulakevirus TaxID=2843436 RepID=A0A5B9N6W6_9CAUD|nr:hypothetical protein HWC25_gp057 [Aeromonas phage 2L372D]YP_009846629.1 hypothetical protein HWC27_gp081 [Aeromonas phage 4L372D]QDB73971.1 hypothetical protein 2L372D_057 [Aeromonas phage 2L372D]QEG08545.1 hypothetical protein [Aeromonas phage 4L372D]